MKNNDNEQESLKIMLLNVTWTTLSTLLFIVSILFGSLVFLSIFGNATEINLPSPFFSLTKNISKIWNRFLEQVKQWRTGTWDFFMSHFIRKEFWDDEFWEKETKRRKEKTTLLNSETRKMNDEIVSLPSRSMTLHFCFLVHGFRGMSLVRN